MIYILGNVLYCGIEATIYIFLYHILENDYSSILNLYSYVFVSFKYNLLSSFPNPFPKFSFRNLSVIFQHGLR
jgi:hypothetical protein